MRRARAACGVVGVGWACVAGLAKRGAATKRVALLALAGCSFVGVKGPGPLPDPPPPADEIHCTTSDALPTLDALAGAGAIAAAAGGVIAEETGSHGVFEHWELYAALPLLAASIVYFASSSHGTHAVEQCQVAKDPSLPPVQ